MTDIKFNALLQTVRSKFSQALKGETESDAFNNSNNYFTTSQIRQLLTLITSESDRVDLAKLSTVLLLILQTLPNCMISLKPKQAGMN